MRHYAYPDFLPILKHAGLADFDALWRLDRNWFEPPNQRRGGISGLCRKVWLNPNTGAEAAFFVKYQEAHCYRSWRHPLHGFPTCQREAMNLLRFRARGLPAAKLVYYGQRKVDGRLRAILITEELRGEGLVDYLRHHPFDPALIDNLAKMLFRLHVEIGYEHRSLCAKHVWIRDGQPLLIDLEKARPRQAWRPFSHLRDLERLLMHLRRVCKVSLAERFMLLRRYLELSGKISRLDGLARRFELYNLNDSSRADMQMEYDAAPFP